MNNVIQANPYQGYYQQAPGMPVAYMNRPAAKFNQPLTEEQINALRQHEDELSVKIDQKDIWRAQCTHKYNGASTLSKIPVKDANGDTHYEYQCSICGEHFEFFDGDRSDVEKAVRLVKDAMQTIKTIYLDAPNEFTVAFYQFMPLMDKLPALWERAYKNYQSHANPDMTNPAWPMGGTYMANNFNVYNNMTAQPFYGMSPYQMMAQGPVVQQQPVMAQPMVNQQPVNYAPNSGMAGMNPFIQPAPAPGMIPQPMATQQPAVATEEVTQNKAFSL